MLDDADNEPQVAHLGRFVAPLAGRIEQVLTHRGIPSRTEPVGDDLVVLMAAEWRDEFAAELFTNWPELVAGLEAEDRAAVIAAGGAHPGWFDAPMDAWIDEAGRLQVEVGPDDADDARAIGPALIVGGLALALLGVFADTVPTGAGVAFGLFALILGLLLPR